MCRINGVIIKDTSASELSFLTNTMNNCLFHGGPDDGGSVTFDKDFLSLGNRRLSILDLTSAGHQPMQDSEHGLWITYNGEIYNFRNLRSILAGLGHHFSTSTDTEVVIKSYIQWGEAAFEKFNGMFSLSLYDSKKNLLYLVRDPQGIKPLYYYYNNENLIFASEIRAFLSIPFPFKEDPDWKIYFLMFGFIPEPYTTLKDVKMLASGHFLKIDLASDTARIVSFAKEKESPTIFSKKQAVDLVRQSLTEAIDRQLISDAPLGVFLSGGIDSGIIALVSALNNKKTDLITISSVFSDNEYNESPYQDLIVKKINSRHHSFLTTEKDFNIAFPDLLEAYDQPSVDGINSYFIAKYAKEIGLKAVLSGLGADEYFGGYPSFRANPRMEVLKALPSIFHSLWRNSSDFKYKKLEYLKVRDGIYRYLVNRSIFPPSVISKILNVPEEYIYKKLESFTVNNIINKLDNFDQISWLETHIYMQNQLLKDADYMSMWHSLELRVPFLDNDFLKSVSSISPHLKSANTIRPKDLLVSAFEDLLPEQIWNRPKKGFSFPLKEWLKKREIIDEMLNNSNPYIKSLTQVYLQDKLHWSRFWSLYMINVFNKKQYNLRRADSINAMA